MSQTELIFRGLDEAECMSFIREVHKRAHEAGRIRDNTWMADMAMVAFDAGALKWFDEQAPETQADWALLRRALIRKYSDNHFEPIPPAAIMNPTTMAIAPNAPAAIPVADNSLNGSPVTLRPSDRLYPCRRPDTPVFNLRVIAPKVSYTGYVSRVFDDSEFGGRCCVLTEDKASAFECLRPQSQLQYYSAYDSTQVLQIPQANITKNASGYLPTLKLFRTGNDWLGSILGLATPFTDTRGSYQVTIREDAQVLGSHWNFLNGTCNWNELTGRLTLPSSPHIMLGKNRQGALTLYFWTHRVWDDEDDAYAAELYVVRAN